MRGAALLALALLATGCKKEPTFDERYKATQGRIEAKSRELDRELAGEVPVEGERGGDEPG